MNDLKKKTADYKIIKNDAGNIYRFFCDISGALCRQSGTYNEKDSEKELMLAWENEGREHFNLCHKCGRWVIDPMYNPDVHSCVKCCPIEDIPNYCPKCGGKVEHTQTFCHRCGTRLMYGGESDEAT